MTNSFTARVTELLPHARLHTFDSSYQDKHAILWGPPGTGKSTSVTTLISSHLTAGAEPDRILASTFTRNARAELQRKLAGEFNLQEGDLPWVRTIHSAAFRLLGMRPDRVLTPELLGKFGEDSGLWQMEGCLVRRNPEDPYSGGSIKTIGDWCHTAEELRRAKRWTVDEAARRLELRIPPVATGWDVGMATAFANDYDHFKRSGNLHDYADMLELVLEHELRPPVSWMFVDEAQDSTPAQWAVLDMWAEGCKRFWIAADDDQCSAEGTLVLTPVGNIPIEDLDPARHRVASFNGHVVGIFKGFPFEKAVRPYSGEMVRVTAGGHSTATTPQHKWLVRLGGGGILKVQASGLVSDLMSVPVPAITESGDAGFDWQPITVSREWYEGDVYSLRVKPHPYYVADGLVTGNSIYGFAGADPDELWRRPGHQFVLSKSFRLRSEVHAEATRIIKTARRRVEKQFEPFAPGGRVLLLDSWHHIDFSPPGTYLLLVRNRCFLDEVRAVLRYQTIPFRDRTNDFVGVPPRASRLGRALETLFALHHRRLVTSRPAMRHLYDSVPRDLWPKNHLADHPLFSLNGLCDYGATGELMSLIARDPLLALALKGGLAERDRTYLRGVMERFGEEGLLSPPKVHLSTIHGVKGEEADHVYVGTSMTRRTHEDYMLDGDGEARVFYVAGTRAKHTLGWVVTGGMHYNL